MKTFEEKLNAWTEGQMPASEVAEFEASLPEVSAGELEGQHSEKLSALLKRELCGVPMSNADFFNHQLLGEIRRESAPTPRRETPGARSPWWSIGRLAWAGAASLAIFAVCTFFVMREENVGGQSAYLTQVINARVDPEVSPDATISMFKTKEDKVTVLWVEGLQSLPSEYAAK